jgi:hypothetical protein
MKRAKRSADYLLPIRTPITSPDTMSSTRRFFDVIAYPEPAIAFDCEGPLLRPTRCQNTRMTPTRMLG